MCCVLGQALSCLHSILCHDILNGYINLLWFYLIEFHYKVVAVSTQVRSKGIYGHVILQILLNYIFRVVLAVFRSQMKPASQR